MATQDQKDQLIARMLTGLKPGDLNKDRLQVFLGDPEAFDRFATEFIGAYERRSYPVVTFTDLPEPKFPDWSKGRILTEDIRQPVAIDFAAIMASPWFHPCQLGDNTRPSGHEVLAALVASYKAGEDKGGQMYVVDPGDAIHGHYGVKELEYMSANWATLPPAFKTWAKGKLLYGYRDILRDGYGYLVAPFLDCLVEKPCVGWYKLGGGWGAYGPGLWEQVGAQD